MEHPPTMRLRTLLFVGLAGVILLVLLEAGARLWAENPHYLGGAVELDPRLGFRGIPGYRGKAADERGTFGYQLNSLGLRGPEIPAQPTPGVLRVVFVGDSEVLGEAVPDDRLMTTLTASRLAELGEPSEIFNLSGIDYGTGQQLLLLRQLGPALKPDAVVLFFHPIDDLINNTPGLAGSSTASRADILRPYLVLRPNLDGTVDGKARAGELAISYTHPIRAALRRHSRLFAVLESRALAFAAAHQVGWLSPWPAPLGTVQRLANGLTPREEFEIFQRHDPRDRWETAWQTSLGLLRAFRDECDALGARLLVVVVPSVYQVERSAERVRLAIEARLVTRRTLEAYVDWNLPERRLARFFEKEGIEGRLLLNPLRAAAGPDTPVFGLEDQLGPRGHEVAARTVVDWLRAGGVASSYERPTGHPVPTLADSASAPGLLDFSKAPLSQYLGSGWQSWAPDAGDEEWGWRLGPSALLALPARDDDLVIRGQLGADSALPVVGRVDVPGRPARGFDLQQTGAFEVRLSWPDGERAATEDGYLIAILTSGAPLVVQQIGFEPAPAGEPDAALSETQEGASEGEAAPAPGAG